MFEIAAILALGFLTAIFAYFAFKVDRSNVALQLLFFMVALFFASSVIYAISDFSLQAQDPYILNETTTYTYGNITYYHEGEAGTNQTELLSDTTTYTYGNWTDYSHQNDWYMAHYGGLQILTVFVLFLFILLTIKGAIQLFYGKKGGDIDD